MASGDLLAAIGIKIPDLVAGFAGGVVNALFFQRGKPLDVVASLIGGAVTANYMTSAVSKITGTDTGVAGFIVGVTAMAICQGLFAAVQSRMKKVETPDA